MKVEIEIPEDGAVAVDKLPEPIKAALQTEFNRGFQKGSAKKAEELTPHLTDPVERERLRRVEEENQRLKVSEAEREKRYDEALKLREDDYQGKLKETTDALALREQKLRASVTRQIRAVAQAEGASDDAVDLIEHYLGGEIDLDDQLEPYFKGADGKPAVDANHERMTIEGRVRQFLDAKPSLRAARAGGGGARGGASMTHISGPAAKAQADLDAAQARLAKNPRDDSAILEVQRAANALKQARAGV